MKKRTYKDYNYKKLMKKKMYCLKKKIYNPKIKI